MKRTRAQRSVHAAAGFTLVEVLMSLAIFSMIGVALVGILNAATQLFQRTEALRASSDESAAVLGALRDDLRAMVLPEEGGWMHARQLDNAGNSLIAFVMRSRGIDGVQTGGAGVRQVVAWWVARDGRLLRGARAWPSATLAVARDIAAMTSDSLSMGDLQNPNPPAGTGTSTPATPLPNADPLSGAGVVKVQSALHFAVWLCSQDYRNARGMRPFMRPVRDGQPDWEQRPGPGDSILGPWSDRADWTVPNGNTPWPSAIRVTMTMAGGEAPLDGTSATSSYVARARSVPFLTRPLNDTEQTLYFRGGRTLPVGRGVIRIGDEWCDVSESGNGVATILRGARRSMPTKHAEGTGIFTGPSFSMIWRMMR